jgi:hypothetical protein
MAKKTDENPTPETPAVDTNPPVPPPPAAAATGRYLVYLDDGSLRKIKQVVTAGSRDEAIAAYKQWAGIIHTVHDFSVTETDLPEGDVP